MAAAHEVEHHTSTGVDNRKLLMWVFLASECLFFGALISTYLIFRGESITGPGPADLLDIPITSARLHHSSESIMFPSGCIHWMSRYIALVGDRPNYMASHMKSRPHLIDDLPRARRSRSAHSSSM